MPNVEKISIALPPEMVALLRQAVDTGEYASSSEVVRDALRDWTQKRSLRQQGIDELRQVWRQAMEDKSPGVPVKEVLDRLERKYRALADAAGHHGSGQRHRCQDDRGTAKCRRIAAGYQFIVAIALVALAADTPDKPGCAPVTTIFLSPKAATISSRPPMAERYRCRVETWGSQS